MLPKNRQSASETFIEIRQRIPIAINSLLQRSCSSDAAIAQTHKIGELVDALPFATEQYGVAKNRLRNAVRYYQSNEIGAARYELRLVLGQLGQTFV